MTLHSTLLLALLVAAMPTALAAADPEPAVPPADRPCRIIQAEKPQFPVRMLKEGITHGMARVLVHVDSAGSIADLLVTAATRQPFATEAQRVIATWKFEPAFIGGEASDTVLDLTFNFDVAGVVLVEKFMPEEPQVLDDVPRSYEYHACALDDLDRMPTPFSIPAPVYPDEWRQQGLAGRVVVNFYIDETGKARFPTVNHGTDSPLATVAINAVRQWRFAPPTSKGRPVLVRARQVFSFDPAAPAH